MKLIKPSFQILDQIDGMNLLKKLEFAGRTCYKSEDKITEDSAVKFIQGIIKRGHETILEHEKVTVKIVCDRGVSHEIVRHRIASYSQESTRYCDYSKKGQVTFIIPPWVNIVPGEYSYVPLETSTTEYYWFNAMQNAESQYNNLIRLGWEPQQARSVLPNSLKTEIVCTFNLREWRHFFKLRAQGVTGKPHPQMLEITIPMLAEFKKLIPVIFDDITTELN